MKLVVDAAFPALPAQPDLFDRKVRLEISARDTDTSEAAARAIAPSIGKRLNVVLQAIRAAGAHGCTADEVADALGLKPTKVRPRVCDLARKYRLIVDSGARRPNGDGNAMIVWVSIEAYQAEQRSCA